MPLTKYQRKLRNSQILNTTEKKVLKKESEGYLSFCEYAQDYCRNSSLHGLRFVGDKNLTLFERIFFAVAFAIAFIVSIQFIYNVYKKWSSTPVIIGLSAVPFYINNIPFPAITICNMNQALASKVNNINKSSVEYPILQTLCSREPDLESDAVNSTSDWTVFEKFLMENSQPCDNMLLSCKFGSVKIKCKDIFQPVLTDEGLCCSFNSVDSIFMYKDANKSYNGTLITSKGLAIDWTPERGYPKSLKGDYYPRTAAGTGSNMGLIVILDAQVPEYYCSSANGAGFKVSFSIAQDNVLLHSPTETPKVSDTGIFLNVGSETRVVITPHKSDASDALKDIKKEYRQCVFDHEEDLLFYSTYSRQKCEMECEAKLLAIECNCITYYMSRIIPNATICGLKDLKCHENVSRKVQQSNDSETDCSERCISSCFELKFTPETYSASINHNGFRIKDQFIQRISNEYAIENIAAVHFYYMDKAFRSYTKEQFIGFTEFLSNTGGLMGLFLGFSFLSLVEIAYYGSFRPYCERRRSKLQTTVKSNERKSPNWKKPNNKVHQIRF